MRNIFLTVTPNPTNLYRNLLTDKLFILENTVMDVSECNREYQYIYITSKEDIESNDFSYCNYTNKVNKYSGFEKKECCKKIILTNDPALIKDGVQAIPDDFMKWFVKNPTCEFVETKYLPQNDYNEPYVIFIQMPEKDGSVRECIKDVIQTQLTALEEAAQEYLHSVVGKRTTGYCDEDFIAGGKWEKENSDKQYSLAEVKAWLSARDMYLYNYYTTYKDKGISMESIDEFIKESHEYLMNRKPLN